MKSYCLLTFLLLCWVSLFSQDCRLKVTGQVTDAHDRSGLGYAIVRIVELNIGVQADSVGRYTIDSLCPGIYTFECNHVECEPIFKKVKISESVTVLHFEPEHHVHELQQITIKARANQQITNPSEQIPEDILLRQQLLNLSKITSNIAGVTTLSTGNNIEKPQIHGLYGSRIAIIQQGSRLEDQQWGNEHAPMIDALAADKVEIIKGASSVRYGSKALGGAIILDQPKVSTDTILHGKVLSQLSSNAPGAAIGVVFNQSFRRLKDYRWKVAASYQRLGDMKTPDFVLSNTGLERYAINFLIGKQQGRFTHRLNLSQRMSESGLLLASQVASYADLRRAIDSDRPTIIMPQSFAINAPRQLVAHSWAIYQTTYILNPHHTLKTNLSYQYNNRREYDVRRAGRTNTPAADMRLHTGQLEVMTHHNWTDTWRGNTGFQLTAQQNLNAPETGRKPILPYYKLIHPALFAFQQKDWGDFSGEIGVRGDYARLEAIYYDVANQRQEPVREFLNVVGNIGGRYTLPSSVLLNLNIGMGYRAPEVHELFSDGVHLSAAAYEKGQPDLKSERSAKIIFSAEQETGKVVQWNLHAYYHHISDYIYQRNDGYVENIAGTKLRYQYVQSDVILSGVDANVLVHLTEWLALKDQFSYLFTENRETGLGLPLMPPVMNLLELKWHYNSIILNTFRTDWTIGARYVGRQKRYDDTEIFTAPPPDYVLCHAGLSITTPSNKWSFEATAENVFNKKYTNYLNRLRYFAHHEGGININLKVIYSF